MSNICPPKEFGNVKEELIWQIREKELEVSRILSKTTFWEQHVDPLMAKEIAKKEEWLSNWYKSQKNYKTKVQSLLVTEENLKTLERELSKKRRTMEDYYERIGCLALKNYQKHPKKWETYENIFESAFEQLPSFIPQEKKVSTPAHSFLHSNFGQDKKLCASLKHICRPAGEKVMQLNLMGFLNDNSYDLEFIARAEQQERDYSTLLKRKRTLEINRNHLKQALSSHRFSWMNFFRSIFNPESQISPKSVMLELEEFYMNILGQYLKAVREKRPANLERALEELATLQEKEKDLEHHIFQSKKEQQLKSLASQKQNALKQLERLQALTRRQEELLANLEDKESTLKDTLETPSPTR